MCNRIPPTYVEILMSDTNSVFGPYDLVVGAENSEQLSKPKKAKVTADQNREQS